MILGAHVEGIGKPGSTVCTASYIPPHPEEVEPCLAVWEKFRHDSTLPPLVTIALAHYRDVPYRD